MAFGNAVSICITGADRKEIEPYFARLSDGGKVTTPLSEEFFGTNGDLIDRFGIRWMFQAGGSPQEDRTACARSNLRPKSFRSRIS